MTSPFIVAHTLTFFIIFIINFYQLEEEKRRLKRRELENGKRNGTQRWLHQDLSLGGNTKSLHGMLFEPSLALQRALNQG